MDGIKILVLYDSITGNVESMAKAVAEGIRAKGGSVDVKSVNEVDLDNMLQYDAFAFGSPTHCGTMSIKMNEFFNKKLMDSGYWGKLSYKIAVAFTSSGGLGGGNEMTLFSIISVILNYGMITFGIPDYVSDDVTLHYGAVSIKRPDEDSLNACRLLGEKLTEHTQVVKTGLMNSK